MSSPRVAEAIARLAMFAVDDFSVDDMLHRLGEVAAAALAVDGVGVMGTLAVAGDPTRFVHASRLALEPLEYLQAANQTGPCQQASKTQLPVVCANPAAIDEWPEFARAARMAGVRALASIPLISRGRCWGVLDLYWMSELTLSAEDLTSLQLLANVAVSYLVMADDRHQASLAQQQLAARLLHDTLTGLANRELIHELIYHALMNADRRIGAVALLFVDLDEFKAVNDERGHRAGDVVLRTVADRMRRIARASDTVSRLGGDEFLVLCEDLAEADAAEGMVRLSERLLAEVAKPITVDDGPPVVMGASIGVAITTAKPSVADFIHEADQAMYLAKQLDQTHIMVHRHPHSAAGLGERGLERQMFGALERGELAVFYQPIVEPGGGVVAVEALLRWLHPDMGLLSASQFIDLAISTGSIVPIGHWVVEQALRQMNRWRQELGAAAPGRIFLNLSPLELIDQGLDTAVADSLRAYQLHEDLVGIEITEHDIADQRVEPAVLKYRLQGHPLALDDFGTGFSSLARLIELPVDYLKLDQALVRGLPDNHQARALLEAIVIIARKMDLRVIGEGVETAEQAAYLTAAGCDLQQGFFHGEPQPAEALTAALRAAGRRHLDINDDVPDNDEPDEDLVATA